jgi:hypothetical protein
VAGGLLRSDSVTPGDVQQRVIEMFLRRSSEQLTAFFIGQQLTLVEVFTIRGNSGALLVTGVQSQPLGTLKVLK